jgi:exodeoxyribonuclease-3
MRLASWNVNGLRARLDFVLHWLRERQPDVVGLQELKLTDEQFPRDVLEQAGYRAAVLGQKSWNGVAVLSREPLEVTQLGLPGQEELGARLIGAEVSGLRFTTIYVPNGKTVEHEDFPRKLAWLGALAERLEVGRAGQRPEILCGDFNVCPAALDSWDEQRFAGSIFHTTAERSRVQRIFAAGFRDVFRECHPHTQAFSWWDYRSGAFHKKQGLRIDLMLATAPVMARVRSVEIDRDYRKKKDGLTSSDHAPVIVDLD